MPPNPIDHDIVPVEQLSLTDQDVEVLHQIILRAEEHPDVERLPFRAIFAAYDAVLSEYGIQADKDRTYLRFLFLLGDRGIHGEGLFAKFEALLAQLGIRLEYSDGLGGEYHETPAAGAVGDDGPSPTGNDLPIPLPNGVGPRKGRPRRASFNSVYDLTADLTQKSINRPSSRLSESRLDGVNGLPGPPIQENTLLHAAVEHPQELRELARRLLAGDFQGRNQIPPLQTNGISGVRRSIEEDRQSQGASSHRRRHRHTGRVSRRDSIDESDVEGDSEFSLSEDSGVVDHVVPSEFIYQPSLSHLLRDAFIFNSYRQRSEARRLFRRWLESSKRSQHNCQVMEQIAIRHDQATLLRQAVDVWRASLEQKRQEARTDRFFKHLEERAARARDLYLLTKVFTHWGQVASEEVQKTSAARQHILRLKYFNAWREMTAVNELKVQRFAMKKPFNFWLGKLRQNRAKEAQAAEFYDRILSKQFYWCWFWSFCYQRAPQWREYRLKQRSLVTWLRNFRALRECEHEVDISRRRGLLQGAVHCWSRRATDVAVAEKDADTHWKTKLLKENFVEWRIQRHHGASATRISRMVDTRVLRTTLKTWALKTRMELQARQTDRARILRNAWTVWNDRLRYQALAARIDERVVMQSLYKWVLMERFRLMTRIHQQRQKRDILEKLTLNSRGLYTHLLTREQEFRAYRKRELLRKSLVQWRSQLEVQRQRDQIAQNFYAPRVQQESLDIWRSRRENVLKMEGWAKDARFYFLAMRTVKHWNNATHDSAKRRRDNAYIAVRRRVKINLVTAALISWRTQASRVAELERQADELRLRNLFRKATEFFDLWVKDTSQRIEHIRDAETFYNRQLVYNRLAHWIGVSRLNQIQEQKASQVLEIHTSRVAGAQLRKLSLRLFQVRANFETADAQYERNMRKHMKTMLRRWADKAYEYRMTRAAQPPVSTTPAPAPPAFNLGVLDEEPEWHTTDGTLHVNELLSQANSTPHTPMAATPGYLNSPSKRASRARALARASTTPATPQRTPFAARLLARTNTTEPRGSSMKKTFVPRSALGTTVRFAVDDNDEPESPTEGRRSFRNTS